MNSFHWFAVYLLAMLMTISSPAAPKMKNAFCSNLQKQSSNTDENKKLLRLIDLYWQQVMKDSPEYATYVGVTGYNHLWTENTPQTYSRLKEQTQCLLSQLKKIKINQLSSLNKVNAMVLRSSLEADVEGFKFPSEVLIMDHLGGVHLTLPDLFEAAPRQKVQDFDDRLARLRAFPVWMERNIQLLRKGLELQVTPYQEHLKKVPSQIKEMMTEKVEDSAFYSSFQNLPKSISEDEQKRIQKEAQSLIKEKIYPSMNELLVFLEKIYIPQASQNISWSERPSGKSWYDYMISRHTTTKLTAQELHALGLKEVLRLELEMKKQQDKIGFKGDRAAFHKYLLQNEKFYYKNAKDLITGYREISKRIDAELPRLFKVLPRLPYGIREMPAYKARSAPTAYYISGSIANGRAGYFEANTYDLKARPKWGMEVLTIHEAMPGHHLQIALASEMENLPDFRKYSGQTAFIEGWGLYSEFLGDELGMYEDPYSKYGQLVYEMWRAVRLVVDTGIHSMGWSRQKAIEYFAERVPKSNVEIEAEIDRYITWPGQALAYKVGQLKFLELREKAKMTLGERFDLREFHHQMLKNGSLPLDILEQLFEEWLQEQASVQKTN